MTISTQAKKREGIWKLESTQIIYVVINVKNDKKKYKQIKNSATPTFLSLSTRESTRSSFLKETLEYLAIL